MMLLVMKKKNNSNNNDNNENNYPKSNKQQKRNITWFNPTFSKNIATEFGGYFIGLTDKTLSSRPQISQNFH